jgi:hypothetical protein
MEGCLNITLWFGWVFVAPAKGVYSPPERVVGMLMMGIEHGFLVDGSASERDCRSPREETLFASACHDVRVYVIGG